MCVVAGFEKFNPLHKRFTNKENLVNQLDVVSKLLKDEQNSDKKIIVEGLFALQQLISGYLVDNVCKNAVFEVLENDRR